MIITATEKNKIFQEVICAAWNDFNKEDFDRDCDRIALVTAQISNKAQQSLRFLHAEAIGSIDAEAFMEKIDIPVFSNDDNKKMLAAIKECISLVKGCEPENEELWKFCKVFILLLFDMDCAESVNRTLSASLIKCNSPENPIFVWSRLVEYAGQCNQAAASVCKESIDRNIRELFPKNNTIQLPPDPITAIDLFVPTIALIGAWKENNEFDRKMIEQISGMEYSEFEAKARTMLSQNSEYLQLTNGNWKVCHKEELLNQCKNKLFDDSIGKLLEAVESILCQKSKCLASKMPYFIPVSGEYDNSLELRGNLVKSLCWVKKNLSELSQCNQEKIENNIYTLVSTLLQDAKWITWTSLRDCLSNLAELSPEAFLKEAERGIINNPTEIVNLFPPKSGELSGINYISNLLWALEILAWSPEYLVHSISVLGLLEALPYERTNWTNTPINSIVSILLPWYPQTMADLEKRKNALKCLKTDNPRVFWSTLKKLLPNKTRSTSGNPRPKYLKLEIPEEVKVTNVEVHECYVYLVELAVDTARNENEKLVELIDQLGYMYEPRETMTKGFFREKKHYSLQEIADNLNNIDMEETRRIVGILKKYGVIKAVKNQADFEDLSNENIVLTDVVDNSSEIEYIFDYVGVVAVEGQVFKCYPKYIKSTECLFENLKQVLKVIRKYNASEQLIYLFNGEDDSRIFNKLAVALHLLETYYADGLYTNQKDIIETNGEGEILWDKTINETFAIIQDNKPYYVELQTQNTVDNDYDYFRRLHECVLTQCSKELVDTGLLDLFELKEVDLTQENFPFLYMF